MDAHETTDPAETSEPQDSVQHSATRSDASRTFTRSLRRTGHVRTSSMPENMISSSVKTHLQENVMPQKPTTPTKQTYVLLDNEQPIWLTEQGEIAVSVETQNTSHRDKKEPPKKTAVAKKSKAQATPKNKAITIPGSSQFSLQPIVQTGSHVHSISQPATNAPNSLGTVVFQAPRSSPVFQASNGFIEIPSYQQFPRNTVQAEWNDTDHMNFDPLQGQFPNTGIAPGHQYNPFSVSHGYQQGYLNSQPYRQVAPARTNHYNNPNQYNDLNQHNNRIQYNNPTQHGGQYWNQSYSTNYGPQLHINSTRSNIRTASTAVPQNHRGPVTPAVAVQRSVVQHPAVQNYSGSAVQQPVIQQPVVRGQRVLLPKPMSTAVTSIAPTQASAKPVSKTSSGPPPEQPSLSVRKHQQLWANAEILCKRISPEYIAHLNKIHTSVHAADRISFVLRAAVNHIDVIQRDATLKIDSLEKKLEAAGRAFTKLKQDYMHVNNLFQEVARQNNKTCEERKVDKVTIEKQKREIKELKEVNQKQGEYIHHYLINLDAEALKKVCHPQDNNWDVPLNTMKMLNGLERYFTTPGMYVGPQTTALGNIEKTGGIRDEQTNAQSEIAENAMVRYHDQYSSAPPATRVYRKRKANTPTKSTFAGKKTKTEAKPRAASATSTATSSQIKATFQRLSPTQALSIKVEDEDDDDEPPFRRSSRSRILSTAPMQASESTDEMEARDHALARALAICGRTHKRINYAENAK